MYSVDGYGRKVRKLLLRTVISESLSIVAGDGISGKYCTVLYETLMFYCILQYTNKFVKMLRYLTLPSSHSLLGPV